MGLNAARRKILHGVALRGETNSVRLFRWPTCERFFDGRAGCHWRGLWLASVVGLFAVETNARGRM